MQLTKLKISIISVCAFIMFPLLSISRVQASEVKLVVSPPSTTINAQPGEIIQKTVKVTNNAEDTIVLKSSISDFIVQDDEGTPIKVTSQASGRYLASPWITLFGDEISVGPKETIAITVMIEVPNNALPGGHYAGVFFTPAGNNTPLDNTGASIIPEVGSLFAITIPGDIAYNAQITSLTTSQPIYEYGPVEFTAVIENQSDAHITTSPKLTIKDILGRELFTESLTSTNIFPFTSRTFKASWDQVWGFGRYSANLEAPYGTSYTATRVLYFWIIPYRLIAAIAVVVLVVIALAILINRHRKHKDDTRDIELDSLKRRLIELENKR